MLIAGATDASIHGKIDTVLAEWCKDWGVKRDVIQLDCKRAWEAPILASEAEWHCCDRAGGTGSIWLSGSEKAIDAMQSLMFPSDGRYSSSYKLRPASLAHETSQAAVGALCRKITEALGARLDAGREKTCFDESLRKAASGALAASIRIGSAAIMVIIDAASVRKNISAHPVALSETLRASKRGGVLGNVAITLQCELGKARVNACSLLTLAPGDVIRLDSLVDKPLPVFNAEGKAMFSGYLGAAGHSLALEAARNE